MKSAVKVGVSLRFLQVQAIVSNSRKNRRNFMTEDAIPHYEKLLSRCSI